MLSLLTLCRPLILASSSPRRAALLRQAGVPFRVIAPHVTEAPPAPGQEVRDWALSLAIEKARALPPTGGEALVLGVDTVVLLPRALPTSPYDPLLDGCPVSVLGKPADADDARRMLQALSGREHVVLTAYALLALPEGELVTEAVTTRVMFRSLSLAEIDAYVATGEPLDKAGAYGIQERGAVLISYIAGDYCSVVGLPLARVWENLQRWTVTEQ
jgi:septum formation protein